jgi:predicted MFS family arabinose efflux permease
MGFVGPTMALATIAVTYGAAAFSIARIRRPRGQIPRIGPLLAQAWSGVQRVVQQPTLRGLAAAYSLYEIAWGILVVVVPVFAAQQFGGGRGATIAGLLWAALGLVGSGAALIAGHLRTLGRERRVMAIGMLVTALAAWPVAAEFGLLGLVLGLMLVGAAAGPIDVGVLTLRQRRTDPAELGRVLSVSISLNMAGGPIGSALGGMLVGWSIEGTLAAAAVAAVLAAMSVALIPRASEYSGGETG